MVYLVPFSIFRNKFAQIVRDNLRENIVSIIDYRGINVFDNITASAAILHLVKETTEEFVEYRQINNNKHIMVPREALTGKWFFKEKTTGKRFGDYFTVQNSVATLYNKAFFGQAV